MTNLLLITDIPRLRKIFTRFSDEKDIRLRIVNDLEMGGEEIVADKPAMVFVQTHLSGFSADILLMHLKKQLGRKRSRFVLLSPLDQVSKETLKLYHGHLDTSLSDDMLFDAVQEMIAGLGPKEKKATSAPEEVSAPPAPQQEAMTTEIQEFQPLDQAPSEQLPGMPLQPEMPVLAADHEQSDAVEPSLEEQGITYSPRSRVSVYSEFTNSFDSAVSSIQPVEGTDEETEEHSHSWNHEEIETIEPVQSRSKQATIILWLAPLLIAVVVITMLQHSSSKNKPVDIAARTEPLNPQAPVKPPATVIPDAAGTKQAPAPAQQAVVPASPKPGSQTPATGADAQLSDKAMLLAIAENRGQKDQSKGATTTPRITALPDFIPRAGFDKDYSAANPGWERYKGNVTEFKIYRENNSIKAIQVIDRGGQGVPESFMKAVLRQISKKPVFVMESSEKKDGYEIQRGQVAENLKVVYYRDEKGGRLRAFVTTWK